MVEERDAYNIVVVRHEGKRPLMTPKRTSDDNIKIDHKEIDWEWTAFILVRVRESGGLL